MKPCLWGLLESSSWQPDPYVATTSITQPPTAIVATAAIAATAAAATAAAITAAVAGHYFAVVHFTVSCHRHFVGGTIAIIIIIIKWLVGWLLGPFFLYGFKIIND